MTYCRVQIYCFNNSNNCKIWWNIYSYIEYQLIVPFQLQMEILIHVISQKTYGWVFHSKEHKCGEKKHFVEKLFSFKRWQELCWKPLYQNPFDVFIKMLDEILKKMPPKYSPKKYIFLPKVPPPPIVHFHLSYNLVDLSTKVQVFWFTWIHWMPFFNVVNLLTGGNL
jgi:hypothetical protein